MRIVVKGNNWLGDAVMSLPALCALKKRYPEASLSVFTRSSVAGLYALAPFVDETMAYETGGMASLRENVRRLRSGRFDTAIVLPRSFDSAFMAYCAEIPKRIGYGGELRELLLTDVLRRTKDILTGHRVRYFHRLLSPMGVNGEPPEFVLDDLPSTAAWREKTLGEYSIGEGDMVVGINPGAAYGTAKQWGVGKYVELINHLRGAYRAKCILVGGAVDSACGEKIVSTTPSGVANLIGKTSISQLVAMIKRCRLFVTNDTGPMHVAAAAGVPIVAIFGSTDPATTSPYTQRRVIVRKPVDCSPCLLRTCPIDHRCMETISVQDVALAAEDCLRGVWRG